MRIMMSAITGAFVLSLIIPAVAATQHEAEALTWEQCHIQTLRHGFTPPQRGYVLRMMHCLAGKPGK
jgi:hypothetical protein